MSKTSLTITSTEYFEKSQDILAKEGKDVNVFEISSIDKVSINVGIGDYKNDSKARSEIESYLFNLTGQKPKVVTSKLSIAGFKLRAGEPVGYTVTLRKKKMHDFILQLIYIALPRTRDFKGIKSSSFAKNTKSYSLGIPSSSIFPVIGFDSSVKFGLQVNIVFKESRETNKELLEKLNFPFTK